jgi:hypothetical protein
MKFRGLPPSSVVTKDAWHRKPRIAKGLGLLLLMAAMACGPVRVSQAAANEGGATLASLAGRFETRGSGVYTLCCRENLHALLQGEFYGAGRLRLSAARGGAIQIDGGFAQHA